MMDAAPENYNNTHYILLPNDSSSYDNVSENISSHNKTDYYYQTITTFSILVICVFGTVGNGVVIWLLCFHIERTPFITFILNLAMADFGVLVTGIFWFLCFRFIYLYYGVAIVFLMDLFLFISMYSSSQFLLTAISLDRCVAVFFPFWHQCRRPPHLSAIVCALIWALSFLLSAVTLTLLFIHQTEKLIQKESQFIVNAVLCLPLMTIATVALLIKVHFKVQQHHRGKLLTIIFLTLLFFLLCAFPFNVIQLLGYYNVESTYLPGVAYVLLFINSGVNPIIYFLVGRQGKTRQRENMKLILQKVFKEGEGCTEEAPVETQL